MMRLATWKILKIVMSKTKNFRPVHGVFLLDKEQGISSNSIMQRVRRIFKAQKAGHTGALDPLATGMLPICFGEATKFSQYLLDADKRYLVTAKLGERTDSSDADGQVVRVRSVNCDLAEINCKLADFRGEITQVPTMFSALKYQGKPLYEYARQGIEIERPARPITIYSLELKNWESPFLTLEVHCSKGTYIRTLIDDFGEKLGCGAHVVSLRRLQVANYPVDKMFTLAELEEIIGKISPNSEGNKDGTPPNFEENSLIYSALDALLLPVHSPVEGLPALNLPATEALRVQQGQRVKFDNSVNLAGAVRVFAPSEKFIGIARVENNLIHPLRICSL